MDYVIAVVILIPILAMVNNYFASIDPGPKLEDMMNDAQRELLSLMGRVDPFKAKFEYWTERESVEMFSREYQKMTCHVQNLEVLIKTLNGRYSSVMELTVIKNGKPMMVAFIQPTTPEMHGAKLMREREYKHKVKQMMDDLYSTSKIIKVDVNQERERIRNSIRVVR